jgi:putative hydrolase of the HAD superfamily
MQAILFDLDETIILDEAVSEAAFLTTAGGSVALARAAAATARELWKQGPYYDYCQRIGHSAWEGLWARYETGAHPAIAGLRAWAPGYRQAVWQSEEAAARFIAARQSYPLYPEIQNLLATLKQRGYKLGIVTNGVPDLQRDKLAGCGVAHLFDAAVISGEIDCGKPDPGIFHHICRQLGVAPQESVMVGDNPERDVAGAMAADMQSVWVQRNGRQPDPRYPADLTCTDLSALLTWLPEEA